MPELPPAMPNRPLRLSVLAFSMLACGALLTPVAVTSQTIAEQAPKTLAVPVGAQQELLFETGVDRIAVANEAVASIVLTRKTQGSPAARILVTGKTAGQTTLMVWEKGNKSATTYQVAVQRRSAILEGQLDSLPAYQRARDAALSSQPEKAVLIDRSTVGVRSNTVQVEVKIVEFNRKVLKQAGINLSSYGPNSHGFSFQTGPAQSALNALDLVLGFGRANNGAGLNLTVKLMEENGLARLLAEPTLVTLSGHSASFLSGGELPVPVPQGLGTTSIEYKTYGIGLTVTPTVLSNDRIVLKVAPEASELDYTNSLAISNVAVPAITTRRADTTVELGDGESYIIGGLVKRNTTSAVNKVPLLGDIPVLGTLFKQTDYQMNETELVLLVTPRLVKPMARNADITPYLPGGAEQRDGPVWRSILLGGAAETAVPGFSR
ncbi:MAG: type II and III secretion system protein family protein [Comamonadaceae bacterium]|nr:MAG: type II and III secretion system protein family protein [Comamonadaceae bacterium]